MKDSLEGKISKKQLANLSDTDHVSGVIGDGLVAGALMLTEADSCG